MRVAKTSEVWGWKGCEAATGNAAKTRRGIWGVMVFLSSCVAKQMLTRVAAERFVGPADTH